MDAATLIVFQTQNKYLRGELTDEQIADILEICPHATKDWDKMKLNMRIKRNKLLKKMKNVLRTSVRKANAKKKFSANRSESRELKKQMKTCEKIERQFRREGLEVFGSWDGFVQEACRLI